MRCFIYETQIGNILIEDNENSIVRVDLLGNEKVDNMDLNETELIKNTYNQLQLSSHVIG